VNRAKVVSLYRVTSKGEVRPVGGSEAPDFEALWRWFDENVLDSPLTHRRPKTKSNYRRTRDLMLQLAPGDVPYPSNLDLLRMLNRLGMPPFSMKPSTVHRHFRDVRAVFALCNAAGPNVVAGNPCDFLELQRPEVHAHAIVNIVDVLPLLLDTLRSDRERAFVLFERYIGRRRGEVLGLRRDALVRESDDVWRVEVTHQRPDPNSFDLELLKNSRGGERSYPIRRGRHPLWPVIDELVAMGPAHVRVGKGGCRGEVEAPGGLLFPFREHELKRMMDGFRAVAPLAFPKGRAWHVFRHTLAVEMNRAGKSDADVAEQLGHSSTYVTRATYFSAWGQRVRESVTDGMWADATKEKAPPGASRTGPRGGAKPVAAGPAPRRSTMQSNQGGQEATCSTPSRRSQRSLPGLAVGPVVRKPKGRKP